MEKNKAGLTPEERERLTAQPEEEEKKMDLKMSLLAFASLLLVCALIVAASIIARSQGRSNSSDIGSAPTRESAGTASHAENAAQPQTRGELPRGDLQAVP